MADQNSNTTNNTTNNPYKAKSRPRPLSPHLQVYKPQITSFTSISHRASGVFLYLGSFVLVAFLFSLAFHPEYNCFAKAWEGFAWKGFFFLYSLALFYHFSNGIRHLFWDFGYGYKLETAYKSAYAVFAATAIFTAILWAFIANIL
jgi:succinate dehydrogenase / fumarate reductase cytochrome b subunit